MPCRFTSVIFEGAQVCNSVVELGFIIYDLRGVPVSKCGIRGCDLSGGTSSDEFIYCYGRLQSKFVDEVSYPNRRWNPDGMQEIFVVEESFVEVNGEAASCYICSRDLDIFNF